MSKKHFTSIISQKFGTFASKAFSPVVQHIINASYVKLMGLDMSEFREPSSYKTLNKLFTRALEKPRALPTDTSLLLCGVDARVSDAGTITKGRAYQIKGMSYAIEGLFGSYHKEVVEKVEGGEFINFYLSPKDYHRYHIPTNLKVIKAVHIPGKFYPVNVPSLKKRLNLFIENERVVILCEATNGKRFYMVLVSALNVGVMQVAFEPKIQTNASATTPQAYEFTDKLLDKGDDFGCFEMGSTIIVLAEKDMLELDINIGEDVKFGQTIAKIK